MNNQNVSIAARTPKYLVCVDAREESRTALRFACMKAAARAGNVTILHVLSPGDFQTLGAVAERMREEKLKEGETLLKSIADEAHQTFGIRPSILLREGQAGEEILTAAMEDPDITIVVLGIAREGSGRGTLAAWLSGQLGHKLLLPILMVPGNLTDQQLQSLV